MYVVGTGNVLKVQALLHICSDHVDTDKEGAKEADDTYQVRYEGIRAGVRGH